MLRVLLISFLYIALALPAASQDQKPSTSGPAATKSPPTVLSDSAQPPEEIEFQIIIADFGKLAGAAYACSKDEDLSAHSASVYEIYSDILKSFGAEKAFWFSAYFGYGIGEPNDEKECVKIIDRFTDRYGAILGRHDLVDGPEE